jgi:hypothetical protein
MGSEPESALELVEAGTGEMPVSLALPHFGQNAELSAICVPQAEQNAITTSMSDDESKNQGAARVANSLHPQVLQDVFRLAPTIHLGAVEMNLHGWKS